jgi:GNAT superfamily N-acetyltransferase
VSYQIISVDLSNKHLIQEFLRHAGSSLNKFRYFKSRPIEVIKNHAVTLVALKENKVVGYGHLDKENEKIWLGTAIVESEKGKGLGKLLMDRLMAEAVKMNIEKITLAVDNDNVPAIALYQKYGFVLSKKENLISYYEKEIK